MKTHNIQSNNEFKTSIGSNCRLLGIDPGNKNIGIAICDENQKVATPFKTIKKSTMKNLIDELKMIIEENSVKGIIIGNPLNMDGSFGKSAQSANDISINLSKKINVPISLWDERLSTVGAFNLSSLLDVKVAKRKKNIDQNAAAFILQGALDFFNN